METAKDYYKILEITKTASTEDIRRSYKRLAKLYHPDTHPGDNECEVKFKEINEANAELSDAAKRRKYDLGATNSITNNVQNAPRDNTINDVLNAFDKFKF